MNANRWSGEKDLDHAVMIIERFHTAEGMGAEKSTIE